MRDERHAGAQGVNETRDAVTHWHRTLGVVVVLLLVAFGVNAARTTSCSNNKQDRFEAAYEASSALTAAGINEGVAFRQALYVADTRHPTIWYCFRSDR